MGTRWTVKFTDRLPPELSVAALRQAIVDRLDKINQQMSTYIRSSEVMRFNAAAGRKWFEVSQPTAEVVTRALKVGEATGGAFDITVGPLVRLWNFGTEGGAAIGSEIELPDDKAITAALAKVGQQHLRVRADPPALQKATCGLEVDLSAIAKGFATDQVGELLQEHGLNNFLVEIGGEVVARGQPASDRPWQVAIESPPEAKRRLHTIVPLENSALATSGDYRNFFVHKGRLYPHIIDPHTGQPVGHNLATVSVLHKSCLYADAFSTGLLVMGDQKGYQWATQNDIAALFLVRSDGGIQAQVTPAWKQATQAPLKKRGLNPQPGP
jgi:thiamine biosynthesis lipoprotein